MVPNHIHWTKYTEVINVNYVVYSTQTDYSGTTGILMYNIVCITIILCRQDIHNLYV